MEKTLFAEQLLDWYHKSKRDLPWRRSRDPYHIWVSEVMLQQTRVETVIPYFHRFIEKFPTLEALAEAPEEEVVKVWEGLGYYSRARNLQAGAREVISRFNGVVPSEKEDISSLKGVGPYTAGAILSIAYNVPEPAVDGNVMRVLSRFFLIRDDIAKGTTRKAMEKLAHSLIPEGAAGDFNQALMEFGATVCTPRSPHCLTCPVMENCQARIHGVETELPVKTKAKPPRQEPRAVAVIIGTGKHAGRLLIRRRPQQGLLAGLWELPHALLPQSAAALPAKGRVVRRKADNSAVAEAAAAYAAELSVRGTDNSASGGAAGGSASSGAASAGAASAGTSGSAVSAGAASAGTSGSAVSGSEASAGGSAAGGIAASDARQLAAAALCEQLAEADGLALLPERWLLDTEHVFSHIRWEMAVFRCQLDSQQEEAALPPQYRWLSQDELAEYAFPNVFLRIMKQLQLPQS